MFYLFCKINPQLKFDLIWLWTLATSFERSQLRPLFPILEAGPDELHAAVPFLLSFVMGMLSVFSRLPTFFPIFFG